jgi:hypothetical protein
VNGCTALTSSSCFPEKAGRICGEEEIGIWVTTKWFRALYEGRRGGL